MRVSPYIAIIMTVFVTCLIALSEQGGSTDAPASRGREVLSTVPADWPDKRFGWSEVNVWPGENVPHPKLVANLRAAAEWKGILTHWIIVQHQKRVNTPKKRELFWGYAKRHLDRLGMKLVPGLKVLDEFKPWTVEQIREESKTGDWAGRLVDEAEKLHREFGVEEIALDWEGFNKLATKTGFNGDHFALIRPAFQRAARADWRLLHWYPGLRFARHEYREYEDYENTDNDGALSDEALEKKRIQRAKRRTVRLAARIRWNLARATFNSPRDRLLVGDGYWSNPTWGVATETRFDPVVERERSFRSLGIHNVIEGFTCAARAAPHRATSSLQYLSPAEVVEMPAWRDSEEVFLYIKPDQLLPTARAWQRLRIAALQD